MIININYYFNYPLNQIFFDYFLILLKAAMFLIILIIPAIFQFMVIY